MQRLGRHRTAFSLALTSLLGAVLCTATEPRRAVVFDTEDGAAIEADLYGAGPEGVVLAHGAVFDKESWGSLPIRLSSEGFLVLALNFRGYGASTSGDDPSALHLDLLAAIEFLRHQGAERISLVGASRGANAAGEAASSIRPGRLATLVLVAPGRISRPDAMQADRFVVIASQNEPGIDHIRSLFARVPDPKELRLLPSDVHAQHALATDQGPRLTSWIIESLSP